MADTTAVFIIDPPECLDPPTDTSLAFMRAGLGRGMRVLYGTLPDLRLEGSRPRARLRPVVFRPGEELFQAGASEDFDLVGAALLFMRKDPPVDAAYLQACAILERLPRSVLQVNPARALRLHGEKLIPLHFGLLPETVVSAAADDLLDFLQRHRRIVVKPLDDCSGRGIFLLDHGQEGAARIVAQATDGGRRFVQGQRFLPEIAGGDKRVLLLGGEILGCVRRVPAAGEFRSNVNAGGHCVPCDLTGADRAICERLRPWLVEEEIHFAGVDIVGPHVLEVNITSPSCLREMNELAGARLEERVLDHLLAQRAR